MLLDTSHEAPLLVDRSSSDVLRQKIVGEE
jgi:hypothetical protein